MRWVLPLLALIACADVKADPGVDAAFQVSKAQFRRGAMPESTGGPAVLNATVPPRVEAGLNDFGIAGDMDRAANGIAVGLVGDVGYWTLPAQVPSNADPLAPTFAFAFGLAASVTPGQRSLVFRAVDGAGRFGPPQLRTMDVGGPVVPTGRLVISLRWDSVVDLDLHVVLPNGTEIFKRNPAEFIVPPPNVGVFDPQLPRDGGVLDHDSNAHCVLDGQRAENVVWSEPPPRGHYIIRVDTFSMCGGSSASWRVEALLDGARIGGASGNASETDLRFEHNRGSGVLALELDVP